MMALIDFGYAHHQAIEWVLFLAFFGIVTAGLISTVKDI